MIGRLRHGKAWQQRQGERARRHRDAIARIDRTIELMRKRFPAWEPTPEQLEQLRRPRAVITLPPGTQ